MSRAPENPPEMETPPHNEAGLQMVEDQRTFYSSVFWTSSIGSFFMAFVLGTLPGLFLLAVTHHAATAVTKLSRILINGRKLLEEFLKDDIQIFPAVITGEEVKHHRIDLYVRFPGRAQFFILFRSMGNHQIVYNEARESIQIRKRRKGTTNVSPCPLLDLSKGQRWLVAKNRQLFGLSSRQASKTSTARVLVICGDTKISSKNRDELYTTIGGNRYLALPKRGVTFVVMENDLATFVRDWLTHSSK